MAADQGRAGDEPSAVDRVTDLMGALEESVREARAARQRHSAARDRQRFAQCDDTCTVDCGHCKGDHELSRPHRG